ncbi:MAG: LPD38 domain-containing protein, partial [Saccharofermentanaceae bacterium]
TLRQIVYNKIYDLRESAPGLFQELDLSRSIDKDGRISYPQEKDPNIIMAMSGGARLPLLVSKEIKAVLDEVLTYQNLHLFEKILIGANKLFTKGTTGLYLPFTLSNFIVDQTTAAAQTNEKIKPIIDPIKTLSVALHSKMAGFNSDDEKYLEEYLVLGGSRQTLVGWQDLSPDDLYKVLNLEKHYFNRVIDIVEKGEDVVAFLPKLGKILTRASEYIKSRKSGKPVIVAMEEAGRVTAPFHHRGRLGGGTAGRSAIQSLPFFNAALQVLAQYGRTLHNPESRKRALYVLLAITAASVSSMAYLLEQGTDKQKEEYRSIPASELSGYVYFPAPDGENLIRIRVPDQMNIIATLMNMAISDEFLDARYNGPEYIDAITAWIPDQLNITDPARAFTSWIPQLAAPLIGVVTNSKFYPHVRPIESMSLENKSPAERYNEYTSWFAKTMGKELNLSPVKIDFLIQGYLGRYTKFITGQKITNPFIREMYISGTRQIQKFYDLKKENSSDYTALNQRTKRFTAEEVGKIKRNHYKINQIDDLLEMYRKREKINKTDPVLDKLVSRILSKIDIL